MNQKRLSPLKTFLFYVSLFSLVFNFFSYPLYAALNHKYWVTDVPYFMVEDIRKAIESSQSHSITEHNIEEIDLVEENITNSSPRKINTQSSTKVKSIEVNNLSELARFEIFSKDKEGVIGYDESLNADDPADNIFSFEVDKTKTSDKEMYLVYEVYGIENASGVAKSINYGNSSGGYFVKTNSEWKVFKERISSSQLKNGENHVMFTVPEGKNIKYYIRNARFVAEGAEAGSLIDFSDANKLYVKDNKAYLHGTVSDENIVLFINEQKIPMHNGSFEFIANNVTEIEELSIRMEDRAGEIVTAFNYPIDQIIEVDETVAYMSPFALHQIELQDDAFYQFGLEDVDFIIHEADYDKADQIAVQPLRQTDIAPFGTSVRNVTAQKQAYRFTPDGAKFANPAQLILKYEKSLLPEGYTDHDISVMFFDIDERKWKAVSTDSIDVEKQLIYAKTTHFTDYIAGIIQAPESPETTSFTPTSISDIKIADPTANIVQIQPPSANQKGDGTVDFPIIVPPGRHGMQPNLALSYNNNGGSSFVGYGWDLSIPYITVDTKFGVPEYHSNKESESYILNGEELMLKNGNNYYLPHRTPAMVNRVNNASFAPKVEGSFSKIERIGNSPTNYYWIVTDKSGTKYYYGQSSNSRFASSQGNIAKWMLTRVEDKNGNYMIYNYITKTYNEGNLAGGKEILISSIDYTFHNDYVGAHNVYFSYTTNLRNDRTINYRYGFKEVNAALLNQILIGSPKWTTSNHNQTHSLEYTLNYTQGKFGKVLLSSVDTKNTSHLVEEMQTIEESYSHEFEYYDDTQNGLYKPEITINAHDDIDDIRLSAIGGSVQQFETTGDFDFGVGIFSPVSPASYNYFSYAGTLNFNIPIPNKSEVQPSLTLTDIDGDGLPDKLVKIGDHFKYRKNIGGTMFSQQLYDVINFKDISSVSTRTSSKINPSLSLFLYNIGWSNSKAVSESNIFMTDVNADGLVDYVKDKIVYFNRIDPNSGLPTFTADSSLTPNRIIKENDVDSNVLAPLPDLRLDNDLMDVVKVWVAPKDGKVAITGTISKQFVSSDDGIRFSVEHSSTSDYIISPSLLVVNSMSTNKSNIDVSQGDMIYFRVNSSQLPAEESVRVSWNPKVTYTTENFDSPNNYKQYSSQYSDSYIYGNNTVSEPYVIKESGNYIFSWDNFTINNSTTTPELTDDVTISFKVYRYTSNQNNPQQTIQSNEYKIKRNIQNNLQGPNISISLPDIEENNPGTYVFVKVDVLTTSQINWKTLDTKFKPYVRKTTNSVKDYVSPNYQTYSGQLTSYYKSTFTTNDQIKVKHLFQTGPWCSQGDCDPIDVFLVVKNKYGKIPNATNGRPAKFHYKVGPLGNVQMVFQDNGNNGFQILYLPPFINNQNSYINVTAGTDLYFEYYTESRKIAASINNYQDFNGTLTTSNGTPAKSDYVQGQANTGLYKANVFYNENLLGIGTLYRNWGQFIYKGAMPGDYFVPINRNYVGLDKQGNLTNDDGEVSEQELQDQEDMFSNTDPDDLDYDFDTEEFTSDNTSAPVITQNQINAIKHFAVLKPNRNVGKWLAHNKLYVEQNNMGVYYRFEEVGGMIPMYIPDPQGIPASGAVSIIRQSVSTSKGRNVTAGFGFLSIGASETQGTTRVFNDYQDVNGDGYPDIIGKKTQLTSFRGGLSDNVWNQNLLFDSNTSGTGQSLGGSNNTFFYNVLNGVLDMRLGDSRSGAVSIGGNGLTTNTTNQGALMDINGDGLADRVMEDGTIQFNTGNGFVNSTFSGYSAVSNAMTKVGGLNGSIGSGFTDQIGSYDANYDTGFDNNQVHASSNFDISAGMSGSRSSTRVTNEFMDINGDGLVDYISGHQIYFNTGTGFVSGGTIPGQSESNVAQLGLTVNLSINIMIPILFLPIGIKFGFGGGVNTTNTYTQEVRKYMDFDGDGYIDMLHSTKENTLKVQLSNIGRTNMLKNIKNPTGSQIIMDYGTQNPVSQTTVGNNYKMPFKKWVLTKVRVHDGFESDGEDVQSFAFEYFNGLKDRRERKFLGFGEVRTHQLRADGAVYRTSIKEYMLNTMPSNEVYLPGISSDSRKYQYIANLLIKETVKDGANRVFGINEYDYAIYTLGTNVNNSFNTATSPQVTYDDMSRILPLIKENTATQRHYQGNSTTNYIVNENVFQFLEYDKYGNVTKYRDDHENINVEIDYHYIDNNTYIVNIPQKHLVSEGSTTLRMSGTELSPEFNISRIHRIKTLENAGQMATTDFKYDALGNLTMVVFPKPTPSSSESDRFFYQYEYHPENYLQYVNAVTDAYGFKSTTDYTNFGMPTSQTDANDNEFHYLYDPLRRLQTFKGPYNDKWTIRNEYKIAPNGLRYAVTAHNITDEIGLGGNVQEDDYQRLHTSTFADGLGRIIQTKKQLDVYQECENATDTTGYRFAVSGKVVYDEFGRAVESYLGQEQLNCNGDFVPALESYEPLQHVEQERTSNFYDSQDRIIQNHVHGLNATTMFEYGYGDDGISQSPTYSETVILPEGNITQTYKDYKGRTTASHQIGDAETLITTFEYDVLSQLTKVTDAENKQTQYQYDSFGNKIEVSHPDNGISLFTYDLTGKLSESQNQKLINDNESIRYRYHFNQLTDISYPTHSVHYKYGNGSLPNDKGRLVRLQDLTGVRSFQYGALGEVIHDQRLLVTENDAFEFNQAFRFDSWGRIMEQTYPDGEELVYQYNSVGQLKSIANTDQQAPQVYLKDVKYNFFDQPTEILYGNDVKTTNEYDITQRIRAMQLDRPDETTFMRNVYSYDTNQNITQVQNMSSQHDVLHMGGMYTKNFYYDSFNRLSKADISWSGYQENHDYGLKMKYNKTHGIVMKGQTHERNNNHTVNSYDADYLYEDNNHPHAPSTIKYNMNAGGNGDLSFNYDVNGNIKDLSASGAAQNLFMMHERQMFWDEQNRLLAVIDDGNRVSHYIYDHAGERTFKAFGDVTEINIGGANIYKVLDIHKYTMYPSGNMVVNIDRKEATKHYYINEKRFASRIIPIDEWIKPGTTQGIMTDRDYVDMSMILDNTDIDSEQNISYATMSIGNPDSNCTAQLQVILQNYENHPHRQHCWAVISHMAETMGPCDALVAANEYVCVDTDPVTGDPIDEESNTPVVSEPETPQPPETMDCITELTMLINDYAAAQAEWEEEQFGGLSIGLFSNNSVYSVGACCPANELCVEKYWETIEQLRYFLCEISGGTSPICEGLPEEMDIPAHIEELFYTDRGCFQIYFEKGDYEQGLEPDCYPMDCEDEHLWSCEVVTGGEGTQNPNYPEFEDEDPPETIYPDSCYGEVLEYIDTNLLADFSNACEVYYYVIQNFDCLPDPWVPEDPGTPEVTPDPWVGGTPNNNPPEEPPYDESQRMPIWWYHSDHLGSSSYITDNFGRPSHYYEYLPFGELMTEHNQSKYYIDPYPTQNMDSYNNPYKFNGKEMDRETGMYYYGARYYDPRISIFVSVDPLAEQTFEPYSYVGNNPIMFIDPTGMSKDGWYEDSQGEIKYDEKINSQKDLDDRNINGEFIAKSFVGKDQNEKYYNFSGDGKISKLDKVSVSDNVDVVDLLSKWETISEERRVHNSGESTVAQLGAAVAVSQADSPAPGPADLFAGLLVIKVLYEAVTGSNSHTVSEQVLKFAKDAGKNDRHGDGGRGLTKAERQIADLESKLAGASGNEAKKIRQKIKNVRESAKNKKKGEEHSRANKR